MYPFIPTGTTSGAGLTPTQNETAGAPITAFDLVVFNTMGEVVPAVSTISMGSYELIGVAQTAAAPAATTAVTQLSGLVAPARFLVAPLVANNGDPVFLSSTSGAATLTPPTTSGNAVVRVGTLVGADGVSLNPDVQFRPQFVALIP